jgi:hypothetical protein
LIWLAALRWRQLLQLDADLDLGITPQLTSLIGRRRKLAVP